MLIGFRHKGLERFYHTGITKGIQADHAEKLSRILSFLDVAAQPKDLNILSFKLHSLKGNLKGFWSITVSANWRVIFCFVAADVDFVDYQDYH